MESGVKFIWGALKAEEKSGFSQVWQRHETIRFNYSFQKKKVMPQMSVHER